METYVLIVYVFVPYTQQNQIMFIESAIECTP